jgi:hypothetical protein
MYLTPKEAFNRCADWNPKNWNRTSSGIQYKMESYTNSLLRIFFQPSNEWSDWNYNLDFPAKSYRTANPKWYAHRGFIKAWREVEPILLPLMKSYKNVEIFGYSHGAAIATLAHESAVFNGVNVETIVFGCPRVCWMLSKIVRSRWTHFTRYQVRGDIVGMVPPWILGYTHVGKTIKIGPFHFPWPSRHEPGYYNKYLPW